MSSAAVSAGAAFRDGDGRGRWQPGTRPVDPLAAAMTRVAQGSLEAFADVYDGLAPRMLGLTRAVLRDHAMAEEVLQEVMLEVWCQAARFDPAVGSDSTWAHTIAHRRSVDRVRAVRAAKDRDVWVAAGETVREYDSVAEDAVQHDEEGRVRAALAMLTGLQREVIVLAYWGGHTSAEISLRLGVPVPTVKTRLRDGLVRLRAALVGLEGTA